MKYHKQAHCVYYCQYHLVLVTKYRRKVFNAGIQAYMCDRLREIRQYYPELEFVEIQHDKDHLHLLVVIPPKMAVGKAVGIIKANTSKRLKELIGVFDITTFRELHSQAYHTENANVEDLGEELKGVLEPYGVTPKSAKERGVFIIPLPRVNSIVVVGFNADVFVEVERWLQVLDVSPEKGGGRAVHIYPVENAKAVNLAEVLSGLYGGEGGGRSRTRGERVGAVGGFGNIGGPDSTSGTDRIGSNRSANGGGSSGGIRGISGSRGGRRGGGSAGSGGGRGRSGFGDGGAQTILIAPKEGEKPIFKEEVRIVADDILNSLIILATARDYEMIREVLRKLDVVPRQVLIETMIAGIGLKGDLEFGIEYAIANNGLNTILPGASIRGGTGSTGGGLTSSTVVGAGETDKGMLTINDKTLLGAAKRAVNIGGEGFFSFITDRRQFLVMLKALASRSQLKSLATPHVIAAERLSGNLHAAAS